jgi:primase-polymerase (primpol)-like protein
MNILNETVKHTIFGSGVITEVSDHKISVQFEESVGTKMFLYPEVFDKFLIAENPEVEKDVLEVLRRKQELIDLERKEKEREDAELKERIAAVAKKTTSRTRKKAVS